MRRLSILGGEAIMEIYQRDDMGVREKDDALGEEAVRSDRSKLRYVLEGLLDNACRFTENGRVALHVRRERNDDDVGREPGREHGEPGGDRAPRERRQDRDASRRHRRCQRVPRSVRGHRRAGGRTTE